MLYGSALYTWAGSEDAPAFVIDVRRIPFEVIFLYGSVLAVYMGGVWFVVNIKSKEKAWERGYSWPESGIFSRKHLSTSCLQEHQNFLHRTPELTIQLCMHPQLEFISCGLL